MEKISLDILRKIYFGCEPYSLILAEMTTQNNHLSNSNYRPDIDGLRAFAVLSVVAFHAFPTWVKGGFIGVDVFFVISGFLISKILFEELDKGTFSFSGFYARRIKRIFPSLLLVLVASYLFGWFVLLSDEYKQLGKHIAAGAGFISNFVFWGESGYFDNSADKKPLLHLWSLGVEEQFYIFWPFFIWFLWKRKLNILTFTIVFALISFFLNIKGIKQDSVATFYSLQTRFWELLCGSILAWFALYKKNSFADCKLKIDGLLVKVIYREAVVVDGKTLSNVFAFVGSLLLGYGLYKISKELSFPGKWAIFPVLGSVFIILAGPGAWINRKILSNKIAVWFGLISFPLYLWHWPLLSFALIVQSEEPSWSIRVAVLIISVVLAWLTYKFVELPMRFGKHGNKKIAVLVILVIAIGYVGYNTYQRNGLSFRFPVEVRNLSEAIDFKWGLYTQNEKCHLQTQMAPNLIHADSCFQKTRPLVALWGDSHASSLYPGLNYLQEKFEFGLTQLTQAGCPPIFYLEKLKYSIRCNEINNNVFLGLVKARPDIIILHAAWRHDDYPLSNEELGVKIKQTIAQIKIRLPDSKIILVGPVPRWNDSPQKEAFNYWKNSLKKTEAIPRYLNANVLEDAENTLIGVASDLSVNYFSSTDILCFDSKCLWRVGGGKEDFLAVDYGHLSRAGSIYLAEKLFPHLKIK